MAESSISVSGLPTRPTDGYCMICDALYPLAGGGHFLCIERARQALALLPEVEDFIRGMQRLGKSIEGMSWEVDSSIAWDIAGDLENRIRALIGGE